MKRISARGYSKTFKKDSRRRLTEGRPRNENAYKGCKVAMKRLLKKPSNGTWIKFKEAHDRLLGQNPTMARVFMKQVKERISYGMLQQFEKL